MLSTAVGSLYLSGIRMMGGVRNHAQDDGIYDAHRLFPFPRQGLGQAQDPGLGCRVGSLRPLAPMSPYHGLTLTMRPHLLAHLRKEQLGEEKGNTEMDRQNGIVVGLVDLRRDAPACQNRHC